MDHVDFDFGKSGSVVFQFSKVAGKKKPELPLMKQKETRIGEYGEDYKGLN